MSQPSIRIETFVESTFGENAYVISADGDAGRRVGWVIDPSFPPQTNRLLEYLANERIDLATIILTHGHADHIAGLDIVHEAHPDALVAMASADAPMLTDPNLNLSAPFGISLLMRTPVNVGLTPPAELQLGSSVWNVLDTGGHSPGGISLYSTQAGAVFTGDALFAGSIGRTDFPGSRHSRLITNIREKLLTLPDETVVYSGHGPTTTIGIERKSNPFVSE